MSTDFGQTQLRLADIPLQPQHIEKVRALRAAPQIQAFAPQHKARPEFSLSGLLLVVFAHAAALGGMLLTMEIEPAKLDSMAPMMVSLVNNPSIEEVKQETPPEPPKPKPVVKKQQKPVERPLKQVEQPTKPTLVVQETQPVVAQAAPSVKEPEVVEKPQPVPEPEPVVEPPRFGAAYLQNPPPEYPPMSRRAGEQGRVVMTVVVSEKGEAESVEVVSTSGYPRLDKAAVDAVSKWRFIPARMNGQAIRGPVKVPLKFSLNN